MTSLTVAGRLVASEDRVLRGRLIPFRKPGRTNKGRVIVHPGGIEVPDDLGALFANLDHLDDRDSVATFARIEEREDALYAEWDVPLTHGGDRLLAEFRSGKRTGVSVELEPVTIRDGVATGRLIGCAFPEVPAFDDARLIAELAPDTDDDRLERLEVAVTSIASSVERLVDALPQAEPDPADQTPDAAGAEDNPDEATSASTTERNTVDSTTATAPGGLLASATDAPTTAPAPPAPSPSSRLLAASSTLADVCEFLAAGRIGMNSGAGRDRLLAALSDIVPADLLDRDQPAWLGEAWEGREYQRRIVPLLDTSEPLTGLKVKGWRWATKPVMAEYAGGKTNVPSNTVALDPYEAEAQRFAGGHDIDRKYVDFGDSAFFASYFRAMNTSYARLTDSYALRVMKRTATPLTIGSVPTDVPAGWVAILDAMLDLIDTATPTFAVVEKTVYRDMFFTRTDKFLEFINASMGLEEGTVNSSNFRIVPVTSSASGTAASVTGLDRGEVLVGCRDGVKFRELGGGTPIRVEALDLVRGGIDEACFGYAHVDTFGSNPATPTADAPALRLIDLTADA